jgi:hypothetical protein
MAELKLAPGRVMQALQSENASIPGGSIDVDSRSFSLKTSGSYQSLDEVRDTVVAVADGRTVRVRDIAEVSWSTQEHRYIGRFNGERAGVRDSEPERWLQHLRRAGSESLLRWSAFRRGCRNACSCEVGLRSSENVARPPRRDSAAISRFAIALVAITLLPLGHARGWDRDDLDSVVAGDRVVGAVSSSATR